eukprot:UN08174
MGERNQIFQKMRVFILLSKHLFIFFRNQTLPGAPALPKSPVRPKRRPRGRGTETR